MTLTEWFLVASQTPARAGVYQIRCQKFVAYSRWNGKEWCYSASTFKKAARTVGVSMLMGIPGTKWRGIIK
jgi:hypothetical protein